MRSAFLLLLALGLGLPSVRAAGSTDADLYAGLQAMTTNGVHAGLRLWYPDAPAAITRVEGKIEETTRDLGGVVGTEVVAVRTISGQVQRYYVAIYYERAPLWVRIDRYTVGPKTISLPLEFSLKPDEILPESLTGS